MPKKKSVFVCSNCGAQSPTWSGKCYACGEWNTLEEAVSSVGIGGKSSTGVQLEPQNVTRASSEDSKRIKSGTADVDVVFGGGIVPGSVTLLAGEPGVGKSTLLMQLAGSASASNSVLYVSGEESTHQVGMRADRLNAKNKNLLIASSNSVEDIESSISSKKYSLVVVDSIQTISSSLLTSSAGSVGQITTCTHMLLAAAKQSNTAVILVGHVTKEGSIAGPKLLEHIVDVVLQIEGERYGGFKVLRSAKNRFGSTNEVAIFEMNDSGLQIVENPSQALLAERQITDGSVVLATMEGTRPVLVEVQALVNKTSYGYPKRAASGFDINRLNLLVAMLERRTKLKLFDQDIYINIVGGIRIQEPAADLALCMAIASAARGMQLKKNAVVFGELGLSGEVRHVPFADRRISEAKKLGFEAAIGPKVGSNKKDNYLVSVPDVRTALNQFLES